MNTPVFRFAPSPNGELHLGHALSALLNAQWAGRVGGRFLLRIENIDLARCTPEYEQGIYDDLAWLGIRWKEPVRRQSEHFADYRRVLDRLIEAELVYPAFMSRGEIRAFISEVETPRKRWPRDPDGVPHYPGIDRALSRRERRRRMASGAPFAWRLDVAAAMTTLQGELTWPELTERFGDMAEAVAARPQDWGDVVLARKDVPTSYHLSVVLDDAAQGVTHVVRGHDLYHATAIQRLLQEILSLPAPLYFHHKLVEGADGRKLSKSEKDTGVAVCDQLRLRLGAVLRPVRHQQVVGHVVVDQPNPEDPDPVVDDEWDRGGEGGEQRRAEPDRGALCQGAWPLDSCDEIRTRRDHGGQQHDHPPPRSAQRQERAEPHPRRERRGPAPSRQRQDRPPDNC